MSRYPGIKPFSEQEQSLFFGREKDTKDLSRLIDLKQTVVLSGKSGYGKSSLINAGVIPELKKKGVWEYYSIRFNNYSKETEQNVTPAETVKQRIVGKVRQNDQSEFHGLVPGEDSFWFWIKSNQQSTGRSKFILFFDQFEELFTYPAQEVNELSEQLSELMYNQLPLRYQQRIAELEETGQISDEFHDFLYKRLEIKVVFSIRSDRQSLLNRITDRHPNILQNCFELKTLSVSDAISAIVEPARLPAEMGFKTPPFSYDQPAIDRILNGISDPADGTIEASTLQIVCKYVEDTLVAEKGHPLITTDILGNITDIFQHYYEGIINKLPEEYRSRAQHLIEDDLIEGNRRNPLMEEYIYKKFRLPRNILAQLEESSLLRKERDATGRLLYEISHDVLIAAIDKVAVDRRAVEEEENKKLLEQQLEKEKMRADDLRQEKEKAIYRYKLAVTWGIISILGILFGAIMMYRSHEAHSEATESRKTEAEERVASAALKYMDYGDDYRHNDDPDKYKNALDSYKKAIDTLKNYPSAPLYQLLKRKIDTCNEHLQP